MSNLQSWANPLASEYYSFERPAHTVCSGGQHLCTLSRESLKHVLWNTGILDYFTFYLPRMFPHSNLKNQTSPLLAEGFLHNLIAIFSESEDWVIFLKLEDPLMSPSVSDPCPCLYFEYKLHRAGPLPLHHCYTSSTCYSAQGSAVTNKQCWMQEWMNGYSP